jgi:hypothetical protein
MRDFLVPSSTETPSQIAIASKQRAEDRVADSIVASVCGQAISGYLGRDKKRRLITLLAQEGLRVKEDGIWVIRSRGDVLLLKLAIQKYRLFNRVIISYGVSHIGLPFPIMFSSVTDAAQFYCVELAKRR